MPTWQAAQLPFVRTFGRRIEQAPGAQGFVYFVKAEGMELVKIGWTVGDVLKRLGKLQTGSPARLALLGFIRSGERLEKLLHGHFAAARSHGEWYRLTPELKALIRRHAKRWTPQRRRALERAGILRFYSVRLLTIKSMRRHVACDACGQPFNVEEDTAAMYISERKEKYSLCWSCAGVQNEGDPRQETLNFAPAAT